MKDPKKVDEATTSIFSPTTETNRVLKEMKTSFAIEPTSENTEQEAENSDNWEVMLVDRCADTGTGGDDGGGDGGGCSCGGCDGCGSCGDDTIYGS